MRHLVGIEACAVTADRDLFRHAGIGESLEVSVYGGQRNLRCARAYALMHRFGRGMVETLGQNTVDEPALRRIGKARSLAGSPECGFIEPQPSTFTDVSQQMRMITIRMRASQWRPVRNAGLSPRALCEPALPGGPDAVTTAGSLAALLRHAHRDF